MTLFRRIQNVILTEPAVFLWALQALVTAWAAFGFRASADQVAAVGTIGAAVVTVVTTLSARPVSVPVITGALATVVSASAAFGLHLNSDQVGAVLPLVSLLLSLLLRQNVTPLVTLRRQQHEPEHAAPAPVVQHIRLAAEDAEALASQVATRVGAAIRPARPGKPRSM